MLINANNYRIAPSVCTNKQRLMYNEITSDSIVGLVSVFAGPVDEFKQV